jgi:hypothetical protein
MMRPFFMTMSYALFWLDCANKEAAQANVTTSAMQAALLPDLSIEFSARAR